MAETEQAVEEKQDQSSNDSQEDQKKQAQSVEFAEASGSENAAAGGSINILLDLDIPLTVSIGKTQMSVKRLLQLGPGSVLQLNKPIDTPADLYIKDTKFATGNIVVVDGLFAVKIKQILGLDENSDNAPEA